MSRGFLSTRRNGEEVLIPLERTVIFGSGHGCIPVAGAAPRHAQIAKAVDGFYLADLTGQGLVFLNGRRVAKDILCNGDRIKLGTEEFLFSESPDPPEASGEASSTDRPASSPAAPRPKSIRRGGSSGSGALTRRFQVKRRFPRAAILFAGVVLIGATVLLLSLPGDPPKPAPTADAARKPAPPPEPAPSVVPVDDVTPTVRRLARKINVLGIAARYAALVGRNDTVQDLRLQWVQAAEDLRSLTASWTESRYRREVPEHMIEHDVITFFEDTDLRGLENPQAARLLGDFLKGLKAGSKARMAVDRFGKRLECTLFFEECPDEVKQIAALIDLRSEGSARQLIAPGAMEETRSHPPEGRIVPMAPSALGLKDAVAILRDRSRRSRLEERRAAAAALRNSGIDSEVVRIAALYLDGSDSAGGFPPRILEAWEAYLDALDFDAIGSMTRDAHIRISITLLGNGKDAGSMRWVALAHLVEAARQNPSDHTRPAAHGFKQDPGTGRWGDAVSLLHYRIAKAYKQPEELDPSLNALARNSPNFGVRYAAMVAEIQRSLSRGSSYESTFSSLTRVDAFGGPRGAREHLRTLALSFKAAVSCHECKAGKVTCGNCMGKTRVDVPCPECEGKGRVHAPGAVGNADVTQKCRNCEGKKVFRDAGCPVCKRTGQTNCAACNGRPWLDQRCSDPACRNANVPCPDCRGRGRKDLICPVCNGTGRTRAPGAVGDAVVLQKCRNCQEERGVFEGVQKCGTCAGFGILKCEACKAMPGGRKSNPIPVAAVFTTDPCRDCGGNGWPLATIALACPSCLGLGVKVKPTSDPTKTLN
jgi:DnaJ-class molecular chaperone